MRAESNRADTHLWPPVHSPVTRQLIAEIEDLPQRLIACYEKHKADIQRDVINVINGTRSPAK